MQIGSSFVKIRIMARNIKCKGNIIKAMSCLKYLT